MGLGKKFKKSRETMVSPFEEAPRGSFNDPLQISKLDYRV